MPSQELPLGADGHAVTETRGHLQRARPEPPPCEPYLRPLTGHLALFPSRAHATPDRLQCRESPRECFPLKVNSPYRLREACVLFMFIIFACFMF